MATKFASGVAGIAIAASLAAPAYAQDQTVEELPILDERDLVLANELSANTHRLLPLNAKTAQDDILSSPAFVAWSSDQATGNVVTATPINAAINTVRTPAAPTVNTDLSANTGRVTLRSIDPFYGDINPFYGDIGAFYGDIGAFYGDINPFYGDIDAFYGDISPFYGDIGAFWGDIDAFYGDIGAFDATNLKLLGDFWAESGAQMAAADEVWGSLRYTESNGQFTPVYDGTPGLILRELRTLIDQAEAQFGAAYEAETGRSFRDDFVTDILARHGVDLDNRVTLAGKSANDRAAFFLDWHDSLMGYSGIDHVDHWMNTINWTPSVTQIQGSGRQAVIGVVDGSFSADSDLADNIAWSGGGATSVNGHGAGVASLIAAAHDGEGILGIAPQAQLATYNPFDADNTATWAGVQQGIEELLLAYVGGNDTGYVSVVNLSLGESGWAVSQGLADVLNSNHLRRYNNETTYVVAAGNDGITQTADIDWDYSSDTTFILVGSLGLNGEISSFSNRPGSACLLDNGVCEAGNELYNRTVVAPGELILVSDGAGGVVRRSGTSFAAPLVSGTISLLHDRWTWLARNPEETAEIIFRSARDLGAPGVDEVYGHGLLDVAASQSPLDFNALTFKSHRGNGKSTVAVTTSVSELLGAGIPGHWETDGAFITAIEKIGNTYRDFAIPVSSLTYGGTTDVLGRGEQRFQDFIRGRFEKWLLSKGKDKNGNGKVGVTQITSAVAPTRGEWSLQYDMIAPRLTDEGAIDPVHTAASLTDPSGKFSFTVGHGQGALSLTGQRFGLISDHDQDVGGVNPILGLASGEVFGSASFKPTPSTTITAGFSEEREDWQDISGVSELQREIQRNLGAREARAMILGVEQKVTDNVSLNVQWTNLREDDALLGVQTSSDEFLGNGSRTDAVTISATVNVGQGFSFDLSATGAGTDTAGGQLFANSNRITSTAGQITMNKRGLMGSNDVLRVSVGQPLTVESGQLEFTSEQVVDRETGELGFVTQSIGIETKRRMTGEIVYATPLSKSSELGLFGRYISDGDGDDRRSYVLGASVGLRF